MSASLSAAHERLVAELERRLAVPLNDRAAALAALTHTSFVNEHSDDGLMDNERLEFLGDAVIDLAIADQLMRRFPDAKEGQLTRLRASVVNEDGLADVARRLGLGELLLLGRGEELSGGRDKNSVLADAMEAVIGVLYLTSGLSGVFSMVDCLFGPALDRAEETAGRDYKTRLQEQVQARFKAPPRYRVISEEGPDHRKVFAVEIEAGGQVLGRGEGKSKKEAEQAAAKVAMAHLARLPPEG